MSVPSKLGIVFDKEELDRMDEDLSDQVSAEAVAKLTTILNKEKENECTIEAAAEKVFEQTIREDKTVSANGSNTQPGVNRTTFSIGKAQRGK